jgi:hypothetical protein
MTTKPVRQFMKPKKTIKSLAELSVDAIGVIVTEPQKPKPPEPTVLAQAPPKTTPDSVQLVYEVRSGRHWGINE